MSPSDIAKVAYDAGFRGTALVYAVAVSIAEDASGNPNARCKDCLGVPEDSRGLWQINVNAHPQYATDAIYDPLTNAKAAFAISSGGSNWAPWSTWPGVAMANITQAANAVANAGFNVTPEGPHPITQATPEEVAGIGKSAQDALQGIGSGIGGTVGDIPGAIGRAATAIAAIPITIGNGLDELKNLGTFFQQPDLWIRVLMVIGGGILVLVGLILTAVSFIPKGAIRVPMAG